MGLGTVTAISQLATAGASFVQAANKATEAKKAKRAAEDMVSNARKKLEVNFLDSLTVHKEPYELEREALLVQGAQAMDAAQDSGVRGVVGAAGRVLNAQQAAQQDITSRMSKELSGLELAQAKEDSRLRDILTQIDLDEAAGAQQAAADADKAKVAALTQGFKGLTSFGKTLGKMDTDKGNPLKDALRGITGDSDNKNNIIPSDDNIGDNPAGVSGAGAFTAEFDTNAVTLNTEGLTTGMPASATASANGVGGVSVGDIGGFNIGGGLNPEEVSAQERLLGLAKGVRGYVGQFSETEGGQMLKFDYDAKRYRPWNQATMSYLGN
mgnify:CR=1 FL=1